MVSLICDQYNNIFSFSIYIASKASNYDVTFWFDLQLIILKLKLIKKTNMLL